MAVRESSGLLSLAELRRQAVERGQKLADEARAQAEAEQRARRAAARERAREAEQRAEKERGLAGATELAHRSELAELEAARAAEFERAEREACARRELETSLANERGAWQRAELLSLARAARARSFNVLSSVMCVATWLGATAFYLAVVRPDANRSRAALDSALLDARRARSDAEASNLRAKQREAWLAERVSALELALHTEQSAPSARTGHGTAIHGHPRVPAATGGVVRENPCRENGDPLDPCLGHPARRAPL